MFKKKENWFNLLTKNEQKAYIRLKQQKRQILVKDEIKQYNTNLREIINK